MTVPEGCQAQNGGCSPMMSDSGNPCSLKCLSAVRTADSGGAELLADLLRALRARLPPADPLVWFAVRPVFRVRCPDWTEGCSAAMEATRAAMEDRSPEGCSGGRSPEDSPEGSAR